MAALDGDQLPGVEERVGSKKKELNEIKKSRKKSYMPKLSCLRIKHDATGESFDLEVVDASGQHPHPTHLVIMVNGLIGRLVLSFSIGFTLFCIFLLFSICMIPSTDY